MDSIDGYIRISLFHSIFPAWCRVLEAVYYTLCVLSVELCNRQISPVFSMPWVVSWGKRGKGGRMMLGARIAALRRSQGWNQAELARRLQISPSAVGMYEQGRREPSAQMLVALARTLGVSVDYLLTGKPLEPEREQTEQLLRDRIDAADRMLESRKDRPFSRQELAVLLAAVLLEE